MPRRILRMIALPLVFAVGTSATVAAQNPFYDPALPIWGVYATGVGYRVNSPAMVERADYEGISIECFKTMTVTVMPGALIPPDNAADYWLAKNLAAGLVEIKAEGLTWWEAQASLNIYSHYRNPAIRCWGTVWNLGALTGDPPVHTPLPGGGWDRRSLSGAGFSRVQKKYYGVQRVFEQLTWTVQIAPGMPEGFTASQEQELEIQGWVSPNYNSALNSAEGVDASLRCIGKCQFIDPVTKRSLGGWLRWRVDRRNPRFRQTILVRSNARPEESFEIEFAAGGLKTVWPYRPRE